MNLLESILSANGGGAVTQLANQFGLREDQASSAIQNLLPALAGGLHRNINEGGLDNLLGALSKGGHQRYIDDPSSLSAEKVREEGNGILGHILGSKDVSRRVAAEASGNTGISESTLKQMLPVVAAIAMGALSKGVGPSAEAEAGHGNVLSMLMPLLAGNSGGSAVGGIMDTVSRFLKK